MTDLPVSAEIVLGMGGCVDYEVTWDTEILERVVHEHAVTATEVARFGGGPVADERGMVLALLSQLRSGTGGERFVEDRSALLSFARRFNTRVTLGGSSVRAAVALDRLGIGTLLHLVSIDDDVRRLLPASAQYLCSAENDSTDPHVIVQYPANASVRLADGDVVVAPTSNRLILVNDPPNAELRIAPEFADAIAATRLVVVSGFNTLNDIDQAQERARQVRGYLARRQADCLVVYEDAGFHRAEHRRVVMAELAAAIDLWSMNEDEAQDYLGRRLNLLDPSAVADAVLELASLIDVPTLVIHTHQWALAYGGNTDHRQALRSGVVTATARYVHGDGWQPADLDTVAALEIDHEVAAFAGNLEERLGAGTAVVAIPQPATPRPTTIGLGDTFLGGLVAGLVRP